MSALALTGVEAVPAATSPPKTPSLEKLVRSPGWQPMLRMARTMGATKALESVARARFGQSGPATEDFAFAYEIGDLSGDGRVDEIVVRYQMWITDLEADTRVTVSALEGDSGRTLWRRRFHGTDLFLAPIEARVGAKARPGLWLIQVEGWGFESTEMTYVIRALDGGGRQRWKQKHTTNMVGEFPFYFTADDYVVTIDGFQAVGGGATDLLVASGPVVVHEIQSGAIAARVTSGATGETLEARATEVGVMSIPFAAAMHDLDGSRGHDYVFLGEEASTGTGDPEDPIGDLPGYGSALIGYSGRSAESLWTFTGLDTSGQNVFLADLGEISGDRRADVVVETSAQQGSSDPKALYHTYAIDGAFGELLWDSFGQWPYRPGDIDGDGSKDFLTRADYADEGFRATKVWALDSRGRKLWTREFRTQHPLQTCCTWLIHFGDGGWGVGDLDGDGLSDGYIWHSVGPFEAREEYVLLMHARSGRLMLRADYPATIPLGASIDRGTADVAVVEWTAPNDLVVKVRDGATGPARIEARLRFELPLNPLKSATYPWSARLDGDRCGDVQLSVFTPSGNYEAVLSGADGRLLWGRTTAGPAGTVTQVDRIDRNGGC